MQMHNTDLQQKFVDGQNADSRSRTDRHKIYVPSFRSLSCVFSTQCDLVFSLSINTILSFPEGLPIAAYVFFLVLQSLLQSFLPFN
jgi:hypothetical protein